MNTTEWNWVAFLRGAMERPPSNDALRDARDLAGWWPTCACGVLCRDLPRSPKGEPKDRILKWLGRDFNILVAKENWEEALAVFFRIEERTAWLLGLKRTP